MTPKDKKNYWNHNVSPSTSSCTTFEHRRLTLLNTCCYMCSLTDDVVLFLGKSCWWCCCCCWISCK